MPQLLNEHLQYPIPKTLECPLDSKEIQPFLKEISPEYSLEGLMLKLKLQNFGHLMQRTDSLEKTLRLSSVAQSCLILCDPMNRSTPGLPVHHHLPEFTQTHVHRVRDISSSVVLFSSCPQSLPTSESPPMSQLFA